MSEADHIERDEMPVDVCIVGAGPAGLAAAIHLQNLVEKHNEGGGSLEPEILVLEKGKEVGAHIFSGAVMDPRGIEALMPDWKERGAPIEGECSGDQFWRMTATKAKGTPIPGPLKNAGKFVVSLNKMVRWLGEQAEEMGIMVSPMMPARHLLMDGDKVRGVQLADAGVDKSGEQKGSFEPGALIEAKITLLAEGSRGSLSKGLIEKLGLQGKNPQVYGTGVKEVWAVPKDRIEAGHVIHTLGWPLPSDSFGGGWVYGMGENESGQRLLSIGHVTGLDYKDPTTDPHHYFQLFKTHPKIRALLEGGEMLDYGAKSLPEGGYYAMPRSIGDGFVLIGDSGGFLDAMKLKGIHLAIRSGMLAAETIFEQLKKQAEAGEDAPLSREGLKGFVDRFESDWSRADLYKSRNFHQGFEKGRLAGLINAAFITVTGGKGTWFRDGLTNKASHEYMKKKAGFPDKPSLPKDDGIVFDKLTDVFSSGTKHEEDQPCHLVIRDPEICNTRCREEYGNPCQHFCPAAVYEMVAQEEGCDTELQLNPSNCVHCKTCDIADPYQIIDWITPEGGGGPSYQLL
ncbi:MAG: electron transfer flavoprotein [Planctomycetota bacterium]|nr:MAG: electron transfer flavoprotein [Planctomycetota bacterium]